MDQNKQRIDMFVAQSPPAPAWFKPHMPHPRPHPRHLPGREHSMDKPLNHEEIGAWVELFERERDLQWPLYWALEMIRRIDKPRPTSIGISSEPDLAEMRRLARGIPHGSLRVVISLTDDECIHGERLDRHCPVCATGAPSITDPRFPSRDD